MSNFQLSISARNAMLDALETLIGLSPILQIRTGTQPANTAAAATGTLLASMTLPSDWLANASNGSKSLSGTWQTSGAVASGNAGHWRIYDSTGTTCFLQGDITVTGSGGDLQMASVAITSGQQVNINSFTLNAGNA